MLSRFTVIPKSQRVPNWLVASAKAGNTQMMSRLTVQCQSNTIKNQV